MLCLKWRKWVIFVPKISLLEVFCKSVKCFLKFYQMAGIKKPVKLLLLGFLRIAKLQNFHKIIRFFQNKWWQVSKRSKQDCLFIFQPTLIIPKEPNLWKILIAKLTFLVYCFIGVVFLDSFSVWTRVSLVLCTCFTLMKCTVFHPVSAPDAYLILKLFKALLIRWMFIKKYGVHFKKNKNKKKKWVVTNYCLFGCIIVAVIFYFFFRKSYFPLIPIQIFLLSPIRTAVVYCKVYNY